MRCTQLVNQRPLYLGVDHVDAVHCVCYRVVIGTALKVPQRLRDELWLTHDFVLNRREHGSAEGRDHDARSNVESVDETNKIARHGLEVILFKNIVSIRRFDLNIEEEVRVADTGLEKLFERRHLLAFSNVQALQFGLRLLKRKVLGKPVVGQLAVVAAMHDH